MNKLLDLVKTSALIPLIHWIDCQMKSSNALLAFYERFSNPLQSFTMHKYDIGEASLLGFCARN